MEATQSSASARNRSLLGLYSFVVCFFSLMGIVIFTAIGAYSALNLLIPARGIPNYAQYESNDGYFEQNTFRFNETDPKTGQRRSIRPSEDELTKRRMAALHNTMSEQLRRAENSLMETGIWLVLLIPIFMVHWRIARREQARLLNA